jgi:hypothetical protein
VSNKAVGRQWSGLKLGNRHKNLRVTMATVRLQELPARVAAHNASKALLIPDPRWDKVAVFNTEVINTNLLALAQELAPSIRLTECAPRITQHAATSGNSIRVERVDFWYKGATENTEIISANLIALARMLAPALQLTAVVGQTVKHIIDPAGVRSEPGKLAYDSFTAANTVVINANLCALALALAAACTELSLVSCNVTQGLWIKSAAENSEIINTNLIAFAQILSNIVVQVNPPLLDQEPPPKCCCLVM